MVKSTFTSVEIPEIPVHQLIFSMISMHEDKVCAVDALTGHQITFEELKEIAQRIASGLVRLGVKKGDVIAFLAPNSVDHLCMFHGSLAAGATITSINPAYTPYEITKQIKDSGAKYIFTAEHLVKTARKVKDDCEQIREVIVTAHVAGCVPFKRFLLDDGGAYPADMVFNVKEDIALLPYSSGTTGMPKGVMLTHYNIVANMLQIGHPDIKEKTLDPNAPDDQRAMMAVTPFYHSYGLIVIMCLALAGGAKLVILPRFTPKTFLAAIEKYKVRLCPVSPPLVLFLAKSPLVKQYDISSLKDVISGAAPLAVETEKQVKKDLNLDTMQQGYGMTETTVAICACPSGQHKPGTVGKVFANAEIEIRDVSTGKVLGPNQRGELCIRGPNVMRGYFNKPSETQTTIKDGWLHTGDIGYYDEDEFFYVVDRIKELIKVKGLQVAPAELEAILIQHEGVADCAVIGVPEQRAGEVPRAYVVRKPTGPPVTEKQLRDYVAGLVSKHKWLEGGIEFVNEIPKSENGKILRRLLKDKALKEMKSKL